MFYRVQFLLNEKKETKPNLTQASNTQDFSFLVKFPGTKGKYNLLTTYKPNIFTTPSTNTSVKEQRDFEDF